MANESTLRLMVSPAQRPALEAWLGPPSEEQLRTIVRTRYRYAPLLAALLVYLSIPAIVAATCNPDAYRGIPVALLAVSALAIWLVSRVWPTRLLFIAESTWLLLLSTYHVIGTVRAGLSFFSLAVGLLCAYLAITAISALRRYKAVTVAS